MANQNFRVKHGLEVGTAITATASSGILTATEFHGDGSNLTNINAGNLSGIATDSSLLEGQNGSYYLDYANFSGIATDSSLLDGIDSGSFLRSDVADTKTGVTTFSDDLTIGSNTVETDINILGSTITYTDVVGGYGTEPTKFYAYNLAGTKNFVISVNHNTSSQGGGLLIRNATDTVAEFNHASNVYTDFHPTPHCFEVYGGSIQIRNDVESADYSQAPPTLSLWNRIEGSSFTPGDEIHRIDFVAQDSSGPGSGTIIRIADVINDTTGADHSLKFFTSDTPNGSPLTTSLSLGPKATELYYLGSKKLETTGAGAIVTGILTATTFSGSGASLTNIPTSSLVGLATDSSLLDGLDSTSFLRSDANDIKTSGDLQFDPNVKLRLGSAHGELYYDNTDVVFYSSTPDIRIGSKTGDTVFGYNSGAGTSIARFNNAGSIELNYANNKKFETRTDGIAVSGIVTAISGIVTYYGDGSQLSGINAGITTDAQGNTYAGELAGGSFSGIDAEKNTLFGYDAGGDITTGDFNTCIGWTAGDKITTGSKNVALGAEALDNCTTGSQNVAIGWEAGRSLSGGTDNVMIGDMAGRTATSWVRTIAIGPQAASNHGSITDAIGIGDNALRNGGNYTVAIGKYAAYSQRNSEYSVYIGHRSGAVNTATSPWGSGNQNVAIGRNSLGNIRNGFDNTALGASAGVALTSGYNNILIGFNAAASSPSASNEVVIGDLNITKFSIPGIGVTLKDNGGTPTQGSILTVDTNGEASFQSNVYIGSTNNYFSAPPSGYGSVQINGIGNTTGSIGTYQGYSIDGRAVFMHSGVDDLGLYDDVNDHWVLYHEMGNDSKTYLYGGNESANLKVLGDKVAVDNVGLTVAGVSTFLDNVRLGVGTDGSNITRTYNTDNNGDSDVLSITSVNDNHQIVQIGFSTTAGTVTSNANLQFEGKLGNTLFDYKPLIEFKKLLSLGGVGLKIGYNSGTISHSWLNTDGSQYYSMDNNSDKFIILRDDPGNYPSSSSGLIFEGGYNDGVKLYHTGNKKLETTGAGVTVTGDIYLSGGIGAGNTTGTAGQVLKSTGAGVTWGSATSTGMSELLDDTTPQLGGDLDTNGNNIVVRTLDSNNNNVLNIGSSAGDRMQIYKLPAAQGGHTVFSEEDANGSLIVKANQIIFNNQAGTEIKAQFIDDGSCILNHDNSRRIRTTGYGISVYGGGLFTGISTFEGAINANGNVVFGDDDFATFGASNDLLIYHAVSTNVDHVNESYLTAQNGGLNLEANSGGHVRIKGTYQNGTLAKFNDGGATELYHDGTKTFETVGTGATVIGNLNVSSVTTLQDTVDVEDRIRHIGDTNTMIRFPTNDNFAVETAGFERLRVNSSGSIGIGTNNPTNLLHIHGQTNSCIFKMTETTSGKGGPSIIMYHDSSTPAAADDTSTINFYGNNDSLALSVYGVIRCRPVGVAATNARGEIIFDTSTSSVSQTSLKIGPEGQIGVGKGAGNSYGTSNFVLTSNGPNAAPSWQAAAATGVDVTATNNNASFNVLLASSTGTGITTIFSDTDINYNPSTNALSIAGVISANGLDLDDSESVRFGTGNDIVLSYAGGTNTFNIDFAGTATNLAVNDPANSSTPLSLSSAVAIVSGIARVGAGGSSNTATEMIELGDSSNGMQIWRADNFSGNVTPGSTQVFHRFDMDVYRSIRLSVNVKLGTSPEEYQTTELQVLHNGYIGTAPTKVLIQEISTLATDEAFASFTATYNSGTGNIEIYCTNNDLSFNITSIKAVSYQTVIT